MSDETAQPEIVKKVSWELNFQLSKPITRWQISPGLGKFLDRHLPQEHISWFLQNGVKPDRLPNKLDFEDDANPRIVFSFNAEPTEEFASALAQCIAAGLLETPQQSGLVGFSIKKITTTETVLHASRVAEEPWPWCWASSRTCNPS
jgi:hypothetical protein